MSSTCAWRKSVTRATVARDHLHRGQAAAGEHVRVDEALAGLLDLVGAVLDDDRLQQHRAVVATSSEQRLKNVGKYCQPTASIISIETSLS